MKEDLMRIKEKKDPQAFLSPKLCRSGLEYSCSKSGWGPPLGVVTGKVSFRMKSLVSNVRIQMLGKTKRHIIRMV